MTYIIKPDTHGWTVGETRIAGPDAKNAGEEMLSSPAYYGSLQQAARGLFDRMVRDGFEGKHVDIGAVEEFRAELESALKRVDRIVREATR